LGGGRSQDHARHKHAVTAAKALSYTLGQQTVVVKPLNVGNDALHAGSGLCGKFFLGCDFGAPFALACCEFKFRLPALELGVAYLEKFRA
ncbi:hypothetical protein LB579_31230, partial [Mesorhizobium sp. BR1-1-7]|uniref:hypothetical protein n=1 Tax=Mesorhizobium sp. BR1-1-7 TaxID=2876647 RepID=UPI001CCB4B77